MFRIGFFFELGLSGVAAAAALIFLDPPYPFRLDFAARDLLIALAAGAPAVAAAFLITSRAADRFTSIAAIHRRVKGLLGRALLGLTGPEIILLSAAAGIGEEVLFRGVFQAWLGFWAASLLFGLLHALTPAYFVLATALGLYLGWLMSTTGNLLPPIFVHGLYDAVAFYRYRSRLREEAGDEAEPTDAGGEGSDG